MSTQLLQYVVDPQGLSRNNLCPTCWTSLIPTQQVSMKTMLITSRSFIHSSSVISDTNSSLSPPHVHHSDHRPPASCVSPSLLHFKVKNRWSKHIHLSFIHPPPLVSLNSFRPYPLRGESPRCCPFIIYFHPFVQLLSTVTHVQTHTYTKYLRLSLLSCFLFRKTEVGSRHLYFGELH